MGFLKQPGFRHQPAPALQDLQTQSLGLLGASLQPPDPSQKALAFCTGLQCTAPISTCSAIPLSLGQGFGVGNVSGPLKSHFPGSSDKFFFFFFPQVQAQGKSCPSELALLIAKSRGVRAPQTPQRQRVHPCPVHFSEAQHLPELRFSIDMKAENLFAICNHPQLVLEHE